MPKAIKNSTPPLETPEWVKSAVFYQIFPDRFSRSTGAESMPGIQLKEWGSPAQEEGFQGGDLYGIIDRLDYLSTLNINALYLTPIFASASNHRYHPYDYYQVDPLLGGNNALRALLDECHQRDMKVVLDGVFNHASRGFWAFHHILENGGNSPYLDWFHIRDWPLRPYSSNAENHHNYDSWWNLPALPKFNTRNPGVRNYLLDVAKHWIEFGADGWRIDAAEEIKDAKFWRAFRQTVKAANPQAYLCGESWGISPKWLQGDRFDALMNYPLATAALGFFGGDDIQPGYFPDPKEKLKKINAESLAAEINQLYAAYHQEAMLAQLNILDSHDTARLHYTLNGNEAAIRQILLFQMTAPGAPCIYYGDEIGMSSAGLPHCRGAFPWQNEERWNHRRLQFYREITGTRRRYRSLQFGNFNCLYAKGDVFVFSRQIDGETAIVGFNAGTQEHSIEISTTNLGGNYTQNYGAETTGFSGEKNQLSLNFSPRSALLLIANR